MSIIRWENTTTIASGYTHLNGYNIVSSVLVSAKIMRQNDFKSILLSQICFAQIIGRVQTAMTVYFSLVLSIELCYDRNAFKSLF